MRILIEIYFIFCVFLLLTVGFRGRAVIQAVRERRKASPGRTGESEGEDHRSHPQAHLPGRHRA